MKTDACVFILLGQSNAVGFKLYMEKADRITTPLKNVYGLSREFNQRLDLDALTWQNYRSAGFNLGESNDNLYSITNCLASLWQQKIDEGENLPDLYLINISIGAQGVTEGYMWNANYPKKIIPGKLDTVDISLYPLTTTVLSLVKSSLSERGVQNPTFLPLWWRGGENDMTADRFVIENTLYDLYLNMFLDFRKSLGEEIPIVIHKVVSHEKADQMDPTGGFNKNREYVNQVFYRLSKDLNGVCVINPEDFPQYQPNVHTNGIFLEDCVHFTKEVNQYLA